ncbi:AraC family transcriptional regulator [bacterium]|nr:MAG: AraC family transcriptional regulator [bacterium]
MKSPYLEDVDYIYTDPGPDLNHVYECRWDNALATGNPLEESFPLHIRRERYHHTAAIPHWHKNFFALYIVRGGRGTRVVNRYAHSMARGDIFLMAPNNTHMYRNPVDLTIDAIYFGEWIWDAHEWDALKQMPGLDEFLTTGPTAFAARGNTDHFGHLSPEPHARVDVTLTSMRRELQQRSLPYHLSVRARLFSLLVQLAHWRAEKTFTTRPARGAAIAEVLRFCEDNFHRPLSTEQLAEMMHFSRAHFCEVFTREMGVPPAAYVRRLRLQHAEKLLKETVFSIADVARLSGFGDATQLGRTFKKEFEASPLDFRKNHKSSL